MGEKMNAEEKVAMRLVLIEEICDFFNEEEPDGYEELIHSTALAFNNPFKCASKKQSKNLAETSKQIYAAIMKEDGLSAADRFFLENEGTFEEEELDHLNSIRRAFWSFFYIQLVKGPNEYEIIDTNNAAVYQLRSIDELGLKKGSMVFTSIIPDIGGYWNFFGAISTYEGEKVVKQVEMGKKRKELSDLYNSEFREYFKKRIIHFASVSECEEAMDNFIRWQYERREKENPASDSNSHHLPEFHLPEGIGQVAMISTSVGVALSPLFAQFIDLISGKFPKEKIRKMFKDMLMRQDLFNDPIIETIWLEYKPDFLCLACDSFSDITDEGSFVKKLLYYRPAIFDSKHLTTVLVENGGPVDDIWSAASPMFFSHNGTGHSSITEANLEDFLPILVAIESTITKLYCQHREIKDTDVMASLKTLRDNPGDYSNDTLSDEIRNKIRKVLIETRKYDNRDVSLAASYVLNSVKLHHSSGGSRGYLDFIDGIFGKLLE